MSQSDNIGGRDNQQKDLQEMFSDRGERATRFPDDVDWHCIGCDKSVAPEIAEKINIHTELCDYLQNLYATKNADYGDSMHPLFEEYGLTAFLVMFSIKIQRIKTLKDKDDRHYESLEDSLLDLANYALIAVTELRAKNHKIDKYLSDNLKN